MSDTNNTGDKQTRAPSKPLTLKRPIESGTVRQSFSHGRSKQVLVETVKRRTIGAAPGTVAPREPAASASPVRPAPAAPSTTTRPAGRVVVDGAAGAGRTGDADAAGSRGATVPGAAPIVRRFTVSTRTCLERPWEKL